MKKLILSAVAAMVVASPILATEASAQPRRERTTVVKQRPNGAVVRRTTTVRAPTYRTFNRGERFDRRYARNYRVVSNPRTYRLAAAPRGHQWVRSGNDALLIRSSNGTIVTVTRNVIR